MRVFLGIPIPDAARSGLYGEISSIRKRYPDLKWVRPESYHITLFFLGDIEETEIDELKSGIDRCEITVPGFDAAIEGLGRFPKKGPPRVIHAPLSDGAEEATQLHRELADTVRPYLRKSNNRFTPHVTIARVKKHVPRSVDDDLEHISFDLSFEIGSFVLYESKLTPQGAIYEILYERRLE